VGQKKSALAESAFLIEKNILKFNTRLSTKFYHTLKNHKPLPPESDTHLIPINDNFPYPDLNQSNQESHFNKSTKRKVITFETAEDR
jgi:hypothetical protein